MRLEAICVCVATFLAPGCGQPDAFGDTAELLAEADWRPLPSGLVERDTPFMEPDALSAQEAARLEDEVVASGQCSCDLSAISGVCQTYAFTVYDDAARTACDDTHNVCAAGRYSAESCPGEDHVGSCVVALSPTLVGESNLYALGPRPYDALTVQDSCPTGHSFVP